LYLDLYSVFKVHGLTPGRPRWLVGVTLTQVVHLVLVLMLLTLGLRGGFARLSAKRISKFQELADELLWSEAYPELLALFQAHISQFFRIYHGDFWTRRARDRWLPDYSFESFNQLHTGAEAAKLALPAHGPLPAPGDVAAP
jgi:hypothetical protein